MQIFGHRECIWYTYSIFHFGIWKICSTKFTIIEIHILHKIYTNYLTLFEYFTFELIYPKFAPNKSAPSIFVKTFPPESTLIILTFLKLWNNQHRFSGCLPTPEISYFSRVIYDFHSGNKRELGIGWNPWNRFIPQSSINGFGHSYYWTPSFCSWHDIHIIHSRQEVRNWFTGCLYFVPPQRFFSTYPDLYSPPRWKGLNFYREFP